MFIEKVTPRFCDTDVLGHINNTVLPVWFEEARTPIFRFFTPDLNPKQWKLIVAKIEVSFLGELFYGEDVELRTSISKLGNSSFVVQQEVWQHGECCARGFATMVRFDFATKSSVPLSAEERAALSEHLTEQ